MKEKILVTGGAGYIGNYVVSLLLEKGYEVVVLDALIYGDAALKQFENKADFSFIRGDITSYDDIMKAMNGVSKVIALAAIVGDPACSINEETTRRVNFESTPLLVEVARKNSIERIVFASSCSVYGSNSDGMLLDERSPLNPVSLYAQTRIQSEKYLLDHQNDVNSVILRLSTVFGLSPRMRFDLAINTMTAKAVYDGKIEVFGGEQWRPFVNVRDVAKAFVLAAEAEADSVKGEIFNVGSTDSNYQMKDIAEIIAREVPGIAVQNSPNMVDLRNYNVTFDKIHKRLNFKCDHSVRDGVRELASYVKIDKPDIYDPIYSNYLTWKQIDKDTKFIPYALPSIGNGEREEVQDTISSNWLSAGPKTKKFEIELKAYLGDPDLEVIAVSSCTAGLHLQLLAAGIGPGDEVITSPLTFCATVNTIIYTGATPVLVDIDPITYNIDLGKIEEKITAKTKAIVPVYYAGQAVDHEILRSIADKHNILILADAAHAMGARYNDRPCGTYEDSAAFSFYATKNMTTGEGGAITTHNIELADKMRRLLAHGMNRDAWKRFSEAGNWYYEISDLGYKYNFTDIQAAFGLHQLRSIDRFNEVRREYGRFYDEYFANQAFFRLQGLDQKAYHTRHLYPIVIDSETSPVSRDELIRRLKDMRIGTSVHYVPIFRHPYYMTKFGFNSSDYPVTDSVYKGLLSLPLYPKMSKDDLEYVAQSVIHILKK